MPIRNWGIEYLLPNISLRQTFETSCVALVPFQDERVKQIVDISPHSAKILNSFLDHSKRKVKPSVLLVSKDAPVQVMTEEALVSFRNAVSIAILIKGWAEVRSTENVCSPLYSDFFDFYPITLANNGAVTSTPAVNAIYSKDAPFMGTTSPYIPNLLEMKYDVDDVVLTAIIKAWERRFVNPGRDERFGRVLFRSLEMAYHATSAPVKNETSLFDYGVNLALWVSAFEILAHPGHGKVSFGKVLDLLGNFNWENKALSARKYRLDDKKKKNRRNGNFVQALYKDLYNARNDFLHGNAVNDRALYVQGDRKKLLLSVLIPVVYRTALYSYLSKYIKRCERRCVMICKRPTKKICRFDYGLSLSERQYEECLLHAKGLG